LAGCAGKRGRAVVIDTDTTAQANGGEEEWEVENGNGEPLARTYMHVDAAAHKSNIVDLYAVDDKLDRGRNECTMELFIHQIQLHGPQGEVVRVWALFDEGAMGEAMSTKVFRRVKHRLGQLMPSSLFLRMADGSIVKSLATWEGEISVGGI